MEERLQKIIAAAGIASRRKAETMIREGRVAVNGKVVSTLGAKADIHRDFVKVDGKLIHASAHKRYVLLNKPKGVISTVSDPLGRSKVTDLVRAHGRLFPVGRLDFNTEGLLLLTNDGDFAKVIAEAGDSFPKTYHVKVRGIPGTADLDRLRAGLLLRAGIQLAPCKIRILREERHAWLEVTLTEGKNREIRKMFEAVGYDVSKLKRVRIGFLTDENLPVGSFRSLSSAEVERVFRLAQKRKPGMHKLPPAEPLRRLRRRSLKSETDNHEPRRHRGHRDTQE
jgi:23S rRNA pseudouridine2605 synthase